MSSELSKAIMKAACISSAYTHYGSKIGLVTVSMTEDGPVILEPSALAEKGVRNGKQ